MSGANAARTSRDAAASICAHLIVCNDLSRVRIAHAVGLPALVIEESIKNGVSSATLRAQLRNWLYEVTSSSSSASSQKLRVPNELFAQLQEDCAADEIEKHRYQRNGIVTCYGVDGSPFSALDPVSQAHFTNLQQSVGQSFISILNDPGEPTTNVDWTTWLGGKLYDAFDFNGRVGNLEDMIYTFKERLVGPESAAALLTEYPPNHDFSAYVKLISDAYQSNRREGMANHADEWRGEAADFCNGGHSVGVSLMDNDGGGDPWPHGVPDFFFAREYDVSAEMLRMSDIVGESMPSAPPFPPAPTTTATISSSFSQQRPESAAAVATPSATAKTAAGASSRAATSAALSSSPLSTSAPSADAAMPSLSRIVDNTTFIHDFEYLESRNKELRAWESAVEKCLLLHVKHHSEDFFATSQQFGSLSCDAQSVLEDAQVAREGCLRAGEHFVSEYLRIGQLYRRRQNFVQLQRTTVTVQRVLRRLGDVENWAALPERDLGEMLIIVNDLVDLEAAGKNTDDSAGSISCFTLSKLKCLAEVPTRVKAARKALEKVVLDEYTRALLSDFSDGGAEEHIEAVCVSATRLGILNVANQLYHVRVIEALQITAQEAFVSLLMNTGTLDDKSANELLSIVTSKAVAFALPDVRQQLCSCAKNLRFHVYVQVLRQFVDVLVDFTTQVSQKWGFFVTGGLRQALAMYDNREVLVEQATRELLTHICGEAESILAALLEVYTGGDQLSSTAEVEQLVRISTQFPLRVTNEVAGRLASLLFGMCSGSRISSSCSSVSHNLKGASGRESLAEGIEKESSNVAGAGPNASGVLRTGEPIGFTIYRPTKVIGITIQRLAKNFFRRQHRINREKVTMVTEGEMWVAKDTVDASIQREVEEMCMLNAKALEEFRLQAVRILTTVATGENNTYNNNGIGESNNSSVNCTYHCGAAGISRSGNVDFTEEVLNTDATKLYVRLPRSSAATATSPSTSMPYPFNSNASTTTVIRTDEGDEEMEDGRLVANSLLVLMDLLHKYHAYIATFPFLAFDVASRMIELIDAYEKQTAAMVLGARAVEKKTLTTITTQHLCVASQCVSFLNDFIPALQAHLSAAMNNGTVVEAARAHKAPCDAVAVACALGLIPSPSTQSGGNSEGGTNDGAAPADGGSAEKTKLFVENDWNRVLKNCRTHRDEFFSKMGSLVYRKVEGLGSVSVQKNQWSVGGNEWVMAMLREVARLMRALRPLLPPADMDGVIVPLIGMLSVMLREATLRIPVSALDDRAAATSDLMLFKANVEKFGYDVLTCTKVTSVSAAMQSGQPFAPVSSEEAVLSWFLPTTTSSTSQWSPTTTTK